MRTTLDIPDTKYRRLKTKAAHEGTSVRQIVLRGIDKELDGVPEATRSVRRLKHPVIASKRKDKLVISNEQIYDLIGFP
jgi:hypothetical protein